MRTKQRRARARRSRIVAAIRAIRAVQARGFPITFTAEREEVPPGARWRSPIHMPRWASRLTLEITSVRVERVRAITEGDARAEGVLMLDNIHPIASARDVFAELWDSINGKRPGCSWADNPWCWCLQFRRIDA